MRVKPRTRRNDGKGTNLCEKPGAARMSGESEVRVVRIKTQFESAGRPEAAVGAD